MRAVIALGGNSLLRKGSDGTIEEQQEEAEQTARHIVPLIEDGHDIVLTHGNGPQVGNLMLQQEAAENRMPLDVLVAETQAQIGYLLQQALDNELGADKDFITVVTQVVVDEDDAAFETPTKPVGPFYTADEAAAKPFETRAVGSGEHPYRRVVPSPEPVRIVEQEEIQQLVDSGAFVVCCGGGGVPVVEDGGLRGVEAVVDKDRTSQVLGSGIGADVLVILTDVAHAYRGYGTDDQEPIGEVSADQMRGYIDDGEFGEGSMKPKAEACVRFIEDGGQQAVITTPENLAAALRGETGTRVIP